MKLNHLLFIGIVGIGLSACHTAKHSVKDDPLNPTQVISPTQIPERQAVQFNDILYDEKYADIQCGSVYKPVCVTIHQNGQTFKKTFGNQCQSIGVLNVVDKTDGKCE